MFGDADWGWLGVEMSDWVTGFGWRWIEVAGDVWRWLEEEVVDLSTGDGWR